MCEGHKPSPPKGCPSLRGSLRTPSLHWDQLRAFSARCFAYTFINDIKMWSILHMFYSYNVICHTIIACGLAVPLGTAQSFLPATQFKPVCRKYGWSYCDITRIPLKGCCKACPLNQLACCTAAALSRDPSSYTSQLTVCCRLSVKWQKPSKQVVVEKKRNLAS